MSVHPTTQRPDHRSPALDEAIQHPRLARVKLGDLLELGNLLLHKRKVTQRPLARPGHFCIPAQGFAAQKNAAIGFRWCHPIMSPHKVETVNGCANG